MEFGIFLRKVDGGGNKHEQILSYIIMVFHFIICFFDNSIM